MKDYLNDDREIISEAFHNQRVDLTDDLTDKTIDSCKPNLVDKKKLSFKYLNFIAVIASVMVVSVTMIAHVNRTVDRGFNNVNSTSTFLADIEKVDVTVPISYSKQPISDVVINSHSKLQYDIVPLEVIKDETNNIVQSKVLSFSSYFEKVDNKYVPYTVYTMEVENSFHGNMGKGQIYELKRAGGFYTAEMLNATDGYTAAPSSTRVEILSYGDLPNYDIGESYVVFIDSLDGHIYESTLLQSYVLVDNVLWLLKSHYERPTSLYNYPLDDFIDHIS